MTSEGYYYPMPWKKVNQYRESLYIGDCLSIARGGKYPFENPLSLDTETTLKKGDPIMEMHVSLDAYEYEGEIAYARRLKEEFETDLFQLAVMVGAHADFEKIKAFMGISHLASSAHRYGFTTVAIEDNGIRNKYKKRCFELAEILHPQRKGIFKAAEVNFPAPLATFITPRRLAKFYNLLS